MKAEFPLWKKNTADLINEFLSLGFKTITCCVNDAYLKQDKVGQELNRNFIDSLPADVDPCGENGEYHTFCFDGPIFKTPIKFSIGEKIYKPLELNKTDTLTQTKGFWYCDLLPLS